MIITDETIIHAHCVTVDGVTFDIDTNTGYEQDAIAHCTSWFDAAQHLAEVLMAGDFDEPVECVRVTIHVGGKPFGGFSAR
jgi:hypothetical protein